MRLPLPLIVLLVDLVMRSMNRKMGSRVPPVRRKKALPEPVRRAAFDRLWQQTLAGAPNPLIDYNLPFPRMEFLNYLCDHLGLAAHGSQLPDLQMLKPVRNSSDATEFGNRQQIFATADAIYAAWFAVWDRPKTQGTHNACMRIGPAAGQWVRLYYFHLINVEAGCTFPYTSGTIYLARGEDFPTMMSTRNTRASGWKRNNGAPPTRFSPLRASAWHRRISPTWTGWSSSALKGDEFGLSWWVLYNQIMTNSIRDDERLSVLLTEIKDQLFQGLGDQLTAVYLYGSYARGDAQPDSDVDVQVVVEGSPDDARLFDQVAQIASNLSLQYETFISPMLISRQQFIRLHSPFLANVRREGIAL